MYIVVNNKNEVLSGFDQHSGHPEFLEVSYSGTTVNIYFNESDSVVDANMCIREWNMNVRVIPISELENLRK